MSTLAWIVGACLAMSAVALIGLVSLLVSESRMQALLLPLVAFSAGSLLGGAFLHLIPEAVDARGSGSLTFVAVLAGFALFFLLEQFLEWHHGHALSPPAKAPVTYLILLADGLHNFIGGLAIGASFVVSVQVGLITWIAAAAHEVPQELGDFAILRHGGWRRTPALLANFASALTIVPGGLLAYYVSAELDTALLLAFAAGNFIYIAASDLIPEVKRERVLVRSLAHFGSFSAGILLILITRYVVHA
ncbi:MAG: ZIP family metal transporter [Acidobacteria bacterium]|nr:ZIP family metal transporter [Acidobacteriota bacterium]